MRRREVSAYTLNYEETLNSGAAWKIAVITLFIISMILYAGMNWKKLNNETEQQVEIKAVSNETQPSLPNNSNRI